MRELPIRNAKIPHQFAWLWEPLEEDATFALRSMFGAKAVYLDGKIIFCFIARADPWRGMFVCTNREDHQSLISEFPALAPHQVLGKWLYLPESNDGFERIAGRIIRLAMKRDSRIGVIPLQKKKSPREMPKKTKRRQSQRS